MASAMEVACWTVELLNCMEDCIETVRKTSRAFIRCLVYISLLHILYPRMSLKIPAVSLKAHTGIVCIVTQEMDVWARDEFVLSFT